MKNEDITGFRRPLDSPQQPSGGKPTSRTAADVFRDRLASVFAVDQFGQESRVVRTVRIVVWLVVFWLLWKLVDHLFVLYWLFSAFFAVVLTAVVKRVLGRLLSKCPAPSEKAPTTTVRR